MGNPPIQLLRGRWTASLIHHLGRHGAARFGELERALSGISPKVLTARLRALERHGLIWREAKEAASLQGRYVPPQVRYGLSETGVEVHTSLASLEAPARRVPGGAD